VVALVGMVSAAAVSHAAMERGPKPRTKAAAEAETPFAAASEAARKGDCKTALPLLEQTVAGDPKNAEALNLLAYCQRKTGHIDDAFVNYRRALELRPKFPAAREYLGEAYVQAALQQIEILRGYGEAARPELDKLVAALRAAADAAGHGKATEHETKNDDW
jgi:cytochrome c-type biogenesis protein CcmH/NrfG